MKVMYIGADVAKANVVLALRVNGQVHKLEAIKNEQAGFEALAEMIEQAKREHDAEKVCLVIEPTGGYELQLANFGYQHGWEVIMVNPKRVRDWAKGNGQRAKTDELDARMLANYGAEQLGNKPFPVWRPMPELIAQLDDLLTRRRDLEQLLLQERNRQDMYALRPMTTDSVSISLNTIITITTQALADIEQAIQELIDRNPTMQEQIDQLDSIPGVGVKTVLPLFVLLAKWDAMTGGLGSDKALTAFVGLDARTDQSGTRNRRGHISKTGDPEMRRLLYMAALGGKRGNNPLHDFYERLVARGKLRMVALIAAAHKILLWGLAIFRSHSYFDPAKCASNLLTN
jgi:transposase